jgi:hypothetical protein
VFDPISGGNRDPSLFFLFIFAETGHSNSRHTNQFITEKTYTSDNKSA